MDNEFEKDKDDPEYLKNIKFWDSDENLDEILGASSENNGNNEFSQNS